MVAVESGEGMGTRVRMRSWISVAMDSGEDSRAYTHKEHIRMAELYTGIYVILLQNDTCPQFSQRFRAQALVVSMILNHHAEGQKRVSKAKEIVSFFYEVEIEQVAG